MHTAGRVLPAQGAMFPCRNLSESPGHSFSSADPVRITSEDLLGLQRAVIDARRQKQELLKDAAAIRQSLISLNRIALMSRFCLVYFLIAPIRRRLQAGIKARREALQEVEQAIENSSVSLDITMDDHCRAVFRAVQDAFDRLSRCQFTWDLISASKVDQVRSRSAMPISFDTSPGATARPCLASPLLSRPSSS